jgi:hypothetical protein
MPVEVTKAEITGLESRFEVTREKREAEEEKKPPQSRFLTEQVHMRRLVAKSAITAGDGPPLESTRTPG